MRKNEILAIFDRLLDYPEGRLVEVFFRGALGGLAFPARFRLLRHGQSVARLAGGRKGQKIQTEPLPPSLPP